MIRDDGYYNIALDDRHRYTYNFSFVANFYSAHRTDYVRHADGGWKIERSRKLWETRDHADAQRRWESLIRGEPRAVHSSTYRSGVAF